jgi:hypothetical protein
MDAVKKANPTNYRIYMSHSQDPKKNPLSYDDKIQFAKEMFPEYKASIVTSPYKTIFEIAVALYKEGVTNLILVVGSDRVDAMKKTLEAYNGVEAKHGLYKFDTLEIVSAGERDPDADGVEGMSASKMREAAQNNDQEQFALGMPKGYDSTKLFAAVRKGMNL